MGEVQNQGVEPESVTPLPGAITPEIPSMTEDERRAWADADQKMRIRRYLRRIAIRVLVLPVACVVPHAWVPYVIVIGVIAAFSAVIGGNDPDAARDFIRDDGTPIPPHHGP